MAKRRSLKLAPIQSDRCHDKKGNLNTDMYRERMSWEDEGRDCGDASTSQETSKIASKLRELKEVYGTDSPSQPSEVLNFTSA